MKKALVLGASGFLGQHMEYRLKQEGYYVVSVARHPPPYRKSVANENNILDLTNEVGFHHHFYRHHFDAVFQLAGNVGGLGHIAVGDNDAAILTDSFKINLYTLEAIRKTQAAEKIMFASSQCVYPDTVEIDPFASERIPDHVTQPWRERDASFITFAFGQEKLFAEKLYDAYARNYGINPRVARCGNTYGPHCTWDGSRAKSVAAICRKVAQAPYAGTVKLWGDGTQRRSFTYVDDAVEGMIRLMDSDYQGPVNIAHPDTVSIADLFETTCRVANKVLAWESEPGPTGVHSRGSDNTLCRKVLGWEPRTSLAMGLALTYPWVRDQALTKVPA